MDIVRFRKSSQHYYEKFLIRNIRRCHYGAAYKDALELFEKAFYMAAFKVYKGNINLMREATGVSWAHIAVKLDMYGIKLKKKRANPRAEKDLPTSNSKIDD